MQLAFIHPHSSVVKSTFPLKKEERIQELMTTVGWNPKSGTDDSINYNSLFTEVSEGCRHMLSPTLISTGP